MATSETAICNMVLGGIGAKRINDIEDDTDTKPEAMQCRLHYAQTRDALLRSHWWRFASHRKQLSENDETPEFEWAHQFDLPNDFLRLKSFYEDNNTPTKSTIYPFALEGTMLLTNESAVYIRYIRMITDVAKFDPLFTEVLVLTLQLKFIPPLSGMGSAAIRLTDRIEKRLDDFMSKVRIIDKQETNTMGRLRTWNDARLIRGGRLDSRLGSA